MTLNTSIDKTMLIPQFEWDETIRSEESVVGMGGKGTDASWILGELGIESLALGFAAGRTGRQVEEMLQERGALTDFTWVEGDSRTNIILIDQEKKRQSTITANSLKITTEHIKLLLKKYEELVENAKSIIIGGSLPPGVSAELYTEMIQIGRQRGVPVVFDSSGSTLLAGLAEKPTLIKPNQAEMETLVGIKLDTIDQIFKAAREINERYKCIVVATLGPKGALVVSNDTSLFIEPPTANVKSTAGAGDAILAGVAHSLAENLPLEEGLRLGFAAAASVLTTLATADCIKADVYKFKDMVRIQEFAGNKH